MSAYRENHRGPMTSDSADSVEAQLAPTLTSSGRQPFNCEPSRLSAVATIGLFVVFHALTVAASIVLLRRNMGGGLASTGVAFLHLIALLGLILLLHRPAERIFGGNHAAAGAIALGSAIGFLLPLLGLFLGPLSLLAPAAAATAGLFMAAKTLRRESAWALLPIPVAAGTISGLLQAIISNGNIYAHVFSLEFTLMGWQAPDPVFHPAIAALIANYGLPTIGVDGTKPLFYHVFSHFVVAGSMREAAESAVLAYPAVQQVFFLPCVLLGSALTVGYLCSFSRASSILAPVATIFAWRVYDRLGGFNTFVESESYAVGIGLFLLGLPLALHGPGRGGGRLLGWSVLLGLTGTMSVLGKFTLAFAWIVAAAGSFWEQQRKLLLIFAKVALAAGVLLYCACLYFLFKWLGGIDTIKFLAYAQVFPDSYWLSVKIGVAAVIAAFLARFRNPTIPSPLFVLCFVGLLHVPDLFLVDVGGGQYYWFDATDRLAIAVLTATAIAFGGEFIRRRGWVLSTAASLLTAATLYVTLTNQSFVRYANSFATTLIALDRLDAMGAPPQTAFLPERSHELARQILAPDRPPSLSVEGPAALREAALTIAHHVARGVPAGVDDAVAHAPLAKAVRAIDRELSEIDAPRPGLFVGPENDWYWLGPYTCTTRNFNFQALTGLALLAGIPDANENCPVVPFYGMYDYDEASRSSRLDRSRICAAAAERRLSPILIVTGPDRPVEIACRQ